MQPRPANASQPLQAAIATENFEHAAALLAASPMASWEQATRDEIGVRLQELRAGLLLTRTFRAGYLEQLSRLQRVQPYLDASID